MSIVYLIQAGNTDLYKIGYTSRTAEERLSALQTGNPYPLRVRATWTGTRRDEKRLHKLLEGYKREGEWFELTVPNLIACLARSAIIQEVIQGEEDETGDTSSPILTDQEMSLRILRDIKEGYLKWGPSQEDGGEIQISTWYQKLLQMGLIKTDTWRWYSYEELERALPFELEERYEGTITYLEHCLEQGHIEKGEEGYRVNPCIRDHGYELFMESAGLL